jgi:phosphonate transport system substrate-binding protein
MLKHIVPLLALALAAAACTKKEESNELIVGFNPAESADVVEANGKALAKLVEERTGLKLKTFVSSDFGALIEAMRSGRVQFGFLPPFSFVEAEKIAGAKVLLKSVRHGNAVFYSAIITGKGYKSLEELKGKTMAWTDPSSSSGHIVPKSALMDLNIDPDTFFSKQIFAGGHDALVLAVANGTVDAGATFCNGAHGEDGAWNQFLKDPEQLKKIHILHVSKPIPGDTLSTTTQFQTAHPDVVEKFVKIMTELGESAEGKKILKDLYRIDSMVPAKSEDYEPLRVAMRRLKISDR